MAEDDDTIETVVYQGQQAAKQLCKGLHRFLPLTLLREQNHRTKNRWRSKFQIYLGRTRETRSCTFAAATAGAYRAEHDVLGKFKDAQSSSRPILQSCSATQMPKFCRLTTDRYIPASANSCVRNGSKIS